MATDTLLDRYQLGPRLGWGGMADVFEARDLRLERQVAVKSYRPTDRGSGQRRFLAEAELLAGLSHPGLLTVFDVGFDESRPFLVLQLASGGTLRDRLESGPIEPDRVAEVGAVIADVLSYVHGKGIVHRDVKPSNVLFDDDGECYLADFGIARSLDAERLTDSREFLGTAAYLAPEQVTGREVGRPADVYALGLVMLECLTGLPEYLGNEVEMALARLIHRPKVPATWGREWRAVLTAMTEPAPEDRPDAAECARLLRALESGATLPIPVQRDGRRRRTYATMATVAAAALVAAGFMFGPPQLTGRPVPDPAYVESATTPAAPPANTPVNNPAPVAEPSGAEQRPPARRADIVGGTVDPDRSGPSGPGNSGRSKGKSGGNAGNGKSGRG